MNTKRCVNCGKLSRADTEYCTRCGHNFSLQRPARSSAKISTPPASPHRAGHYSGFHPEDQPYQSTFMAVLRPPIPPSLSPSSSDPNATWVPKSERQAVERIDHVDRVEQEETNEFMLPPSLSPSPSPSSSNPNATWVPRSERQAVARQEQDQLILPRIATGPEPAPIAIPEYRRASAIPSFPSDPDLQILPSFVYRKASTQTRAVPILLTIFCLMILVATSLLAFLFLSKRHEPVAKLSLTAVPNLLRVNDTFTLTGTGFGTDDLISFSRDKNNVPILVQAHTDETGAFSVQIMVTSGWGLGLHTIHATDEAQQLAASAPITIEAPSAAPPKLQLQLSNPKIDFGAGDPGVISKKSITLTNSGGGQITWQATSSNQNWLTVTPNKHTFSGSEGVDLIVNRGEQPPGPYTGYVTFTQQESTNLSLTLSVTMSINVAKAPAANLVLSTASLSYSGSTAQNPPDQFITLQNSGGQPIDWSATVTTGDGAPWLSMNPGGGHLDARTSTKITVTVQSLRMAIESYQGTISFQGGVNPQVTVTLSVVTPANLTVSPTPLNLLAAQGQKSAGQITVQDSGGQSLDWTTSAVSTGGANWLSLSPASGHLDPGVMKNITVTADAGTLAVNSYYGTLTFSYGTSTRQVTITLLVSLPPMPGISVQPSSLIFNTPQGLNPPAQSFTITNIGNAPLDWATTEDANGTTYAATSSSGSTTSLAPAKSVTITVTPKVTSAGPGSISALITVFDSDNGSTVPQQQVAVTINITSAAIITASPSTMTFDHTSTITNSQQFLNITNTGSASLNWSLAQGSQPPVPWLSVNMTGGTLAPGEMVTIFVTCDSSQLSPGTYTATLVVSDSDPGSSVVQQTITVTLTVSS